jgi:C-terminal processing protease CtpA/Prc
MGGQPSSSQTTRQSRAAGLGDRPIDAHEARVTAHELAHEMEAYYLFPEIGRRYAAAIRAKALSGVYDSIRSSAALAERLQADLLSVAKDNHLRVVVGAPDGPRPSQVTVNPDASRPRGRLRPIENSLEPPRWAAPGVAYLKINSFAGDEAQLAAVRQFMTDYAGARAIIFDLRANDGGGFAEMDIIFPYLFAKPTTLAMLDTRAEADPISFTRLAEGPTLSRGQDVDGYVRRIHTVEPHPSERRLHSVPVFVLTSNATRSSGEHFAMALKHTGRGLVIGETTAGAGHTTMMRPLGGGFAVAVPVGHTVNPKTGKGWEAVGIDPDIRSPAPQALAETLVRIGLPRQEAQRISAEVDREAASRSAAVNAPTQSYSPPQRPAVMLGVMPAADERPGTGALVAGVLAGTTGAAIGLREGDLIVSINGTEIPSTGAIMEVVRSLKVGDELTLRVLRGDQIVDLVGRALGPPSP